ncbi:conserved membrane hypothetical protein [uncultured Eubacteriales bacterium]|uniref:Enolase n=1 Tax=uncultured Eubacteriales bacterium TaxID=172733 RepID=A0A212JSH2_9FIRM|nr:conserved membrane hypothetical protein [uncultured Eubacteriales bacterium]
MDITVFGVGGVAVITIICYMVGEIVKVSPLDNKVIPVIMGLFGAVLGPTAMIFTPEFPAGDPITAIAVGIVSGLAATGANQVVKQLKGE